MIQWWQTSKTKIRKNIFLVSEWKHHSKIINQYHLHTTKAVQAGKNPKETQQKVHGRESLEFNDTVGLRKLAGSWAEVCRKASSQHGLTNTVVTLADEDNTAYPQGTLTRKYRHEPDENTEILPYETL